MTGKRKTRWNHSEAFVNLRRIKLFDRTQDILDAENVELEEAALEYADEMRPKKRGKKCI